MYEKVWPTMLGFMKNHFFLYSTLSIVFLTLVFLWIYNRMVSLKKRAEGAWSDIDVQLKRRHDLINPLIACVEGYMQHERNTLIHVTESRQRAVDSKRVSQRGQFEKTLTDSIKSLILLAENYPDLKASGVFLDLQQKLTETEDLIQYARRYYNAVVRDFNTLIRQFPSLLIAQPMGFSPLDFFQLDNESESQVQKVKVGLN